MKRAKTTDLYDTFTSKVFITPFLDVAHTLDSSNAVIGNEDLGDDPGATESFDQLLRAGRSLKIVESERYCNLVPTYL